MVDVLLSHPKRQFYPFENNRHTFYLYYENFRWHLTNENASRITLHRTDIYRRLAIWCPWNEDMTIADESQFEQLRKYPEKSFWFVFGLVVFDGQVIATAPQSKTQPTWEGDQPTL